MAKVRLKPGVSREQGASELRAMGVSHKQRLPDYHEALKRKKYDFLEKFPLSKEH